jgi:addiction module HigA family antidote
METPTMSKSSTTTDRLPPIHPGEVLREDFMAPLGLSATALARHIGVPPNRITAILNGRRGVTGDTALRLGAAFATTPQFWLNLQSRWELESARDAAPDLRIAPVAA